MTSYLKQFLHAFEERDLLSAQKLIAHHPVEIDVHWNREYVFTSACRRGWIEFAQWLVSIESSHGLFNVHARNEAAFRWACRYCHRPVAEWLLTLEPTHGPIDIHCNKEEILRLACRKGHLDLLYWLFSHEPTHGEINIHIQDDRAYADFRYDLSPFNHACRHGHLEIVKFLVSLETTHAQLDVHFSADRAFRWACARGHLYVAQWLLTLEPTHRRFQLDWILLGRKVHAEIWSTSLGVEPESPSAIEDDSGLFCACRNGHTDMVDWLVGLIALPHWIVKRAFELACQYGQLSLAGWLLTDPRTRDHINIHHNHEGPFQRACAGGHQEVAKWLLTLEAQHGSIDIHIQREAPFRHACSGGHIELANWLLALDKTHKAVDLKEIVPESFYAACSENQFAMAEWLFKLGETHDALNLNATTCRAVYERCLAQNRFTLASWLLSRFPGYYTNVEIAGPVYNFLDHVLSWRLGLLVPALVTRTQSMSAKDAMRVLKMTYRHRLLSRKGRRRIALALTHHAQRLLTGQ